VAALVDHAPSVQGRVEGSLWQLRPEWVNLNSGAQVAGDWWMPGTPSVQVNGQPAFGGVFPQDGLAAPSHHGFLLNSGSTLGRLLTRVDPIALPEASAVAAPAGHRSVVLDNPTQTVGDWSTLRNLTLQGAAPTVAVPSGAYGTFSVNAPAKLVLGVAGAVEPSVYHFQSLNLNGGARVELAGPIILHVAQSLAANADLGLAGRTDWLILHLPTGNLTLNSASRLDGVVLAPRGTVTINSQCRLAGRVVARRLVVNGGGVLSGAGSFLPWAPDHGPANQAPEADAGPDATYRLDLDYTFPLAGAVSDDGLPLGQPPQVEWTLTQGPGEASFADRHSADTMVTVSTPGLYVFRLWASDSELEASDEVSVAVGQTNRNPVFLSSPLESAREGELYAYEVRFDDPDLVFGDSLEVGVDAAPDWLTFERVGETMALLAGTPDRADVGEPLVHLWVRDLEGEVTIQIFSIRVQRANVAPIAIGEEFFLHQGDPSAWTPRGEDGDGDPLVFVLSHGPANGRLWTAQGTEILEFPATTEESHWPLAYAPAPGFFGEDSLGFRAFDGIEHSAPETVRWVVNARPRVSWLAPAEDGSTVETGVVGLVVDAVDPDGEVVRVDFFAGDTLLGSSSTTPFSLDWTADEPGDFVLRAVAWDNLGASEASPDRAITIRRILPPQFLSEPVEAVSEGEVYDYAIEAFSETLAHGGDLSILAEDLPTWLQLIDQGQGMARLVGHPSRGEVGGHPVRLRAVDAAGRAAEQSFTIAVQYVNYPPVAQDASFELARFGSLTDTLAPFASDPDGDGITFSLVTGVTNGSLSFSTDGSFSYSPAGSFHGADSFTYQVDDGALPSRLASVTMTVSFVNRYPVADDLNVTTLEDASVVLPLGASDADGDLLELVLLSLPASGRVEADGVVLDVGTRVSADTEFRYFPSPQFAGQITFTFAAWDGIVSSDPAAVTVTVQARNRVPVVFAGENRSLTMDGPYSFALAGTATDDGLPAGSTLVATWELVSGSGEASIGDPSQLDTAVTVSAPGSYTFRLTASDGELTASDEVTLSVRALPRKKVWTTTADFAAADRTNVRAMEDRALLATDTRAFNFLWIPIFSNGTIVRVDADTGRVLGHYRTAPEGQPHNPSRTSVASDGSVWVGNRAGNSVTNIRLPDPLAPAANTSVGLGDLLPWSNAGGADTNGGVSTAQDELIRHYVRVRPSGIRHVSVDTQDRVWVGGTGNRVWDLVDTRTAAVIRQEPSVGLGGYGGVVDANGILWSARPLLWWDTSRSLSESTSSGAWKALPGDSYGIAIDHDGNAWTTGWSVSTVAKFSPSGELIGRFPQGSSNGRGIVIDNDNDVWLANSASDTLTRLKPDGRMVGTVVVGQQPRGVALDAKGRIWAILAGGTAVRVDPHAGPLGADGVTPVGAVDLRTDYLGGTIYAYSDMTGSSVTRNPDWGQWRDVFDSGVAGTAWDPAAWRVETCGDARIEVRVATREDGEDFGPWQTVTLAEPAISLVGRHIAVEIAFHRASSGESPVLHELALATAGFATALIEPEWEVTAGPPLQGTWPDTYALRGGLCTNGFPYAGEVSFQWEKLSGPGDVVFTDASSAHTEATFSLSGAYLLRLTAFAGADVREAEVEVVLTPINRAPWVDPGPPQYYHLSPDEPILLEGYARDDGLPLGATLATRWSLVHGPGEVTFGDEASPVTEAFFSASGIYLLEFEADDSELQTSQRVEVRVNIPCQVDLSADLAAWWPANGDADEIVRGSVAELVGGVTYGDGAVSQGFAFNGSGHVVSPAHPSLDLNASAEGFTIECWARVAFTGESRRLMGWYEGTSEGVHLFAQYEHLYVRLSYPGSSQTLSVSHALSPTLYHHIAVTYDRPSGTATVYVDGVQRASSNVGDRQFLTQGQFYLGGHPLVSARLNGSLDEVALYRRALSPGEIASIHAAGAAGKCWPGGANEPPVVDAGPDLGLASGATVALGGAVADDGLPHGQLWTLWRQLSGPAEVDFADAQDPDTAATFPAAGLYTLELWASDGLAEARDTRNVRVGAPCAVEPDASLAAWWTLNHHGRNEVAGGPPMDLLGATYGPARVGAGLHFGGGLQTARTATSDPSLDLNASAEGFTIECWARVAFTGESRRLMGWYEGTSEGVHLFAQYEHLYVRLNYPGSSQTLTVSNVLSATDYRHIAVTYDRPSGTAVVFVNGVQRASSNVGDRQFLTQGQFYLGGHPLVGARLNGSLDEVALYRRALSPGEIASIHAAGAAGKCWPGGANEPPVVDAGPDLGLASGATVALGGAVADDGLPRGQLWTLWRQLSGPAEVDFADAQDPDTAATFPAAGLYTLELWASDGLAEARDTRNVRVGAPCAVEPDASLAAWWTLNHHGRNEVAGGPPMDLLGATYGPARVGAGLHFGGGLQTARTATSDPSLDLNASAEGFTIECWARVAFTGENRRLMGWYEGTSEGVHLFAQYEHLHVRLNYPGSSQTLSVSHALSPTLHHHIAVTYDRPSGTATVFVNGVQRASSNVGDRQFLTQGQFYLGGHPLVGARLNGSLDEVALYRRALSPGEIASIHAAGAAGKCWPGTANEPPVVDAGPDLGLASGATVALGGAVADDGLPRGQLWTLWRQLSGPAEVDFADAQDPDTAATFPAAGLYTLELWASDGLAEARDTRNVRVGAPCAVEPDASLAAWWTLNHHGRNEVAGGPPMDLLGATYGPARVGAGLHFGGGLQTARTATSDPSLDLNASAEGFTIECWARVAFTGESRRLMGWYEGTSDGVFLFAQYEHLYVRLSYPGSSQTLSVSHALSPTLYHHIAVTYDRPSGTATVYVDGVQRASSNVGDRQFLTQGQFYLGGHPLVGARLNGSLDEVALYRRALSPGEIASIHAAGAAGKCWPTPQNRAPEVVMDATASLVLALGNIATFQPNPRVSDDGLPENSALSYAWSIIAGPAAIDIDDASARRPVLTFHAPGTYELTLLVSDGELATSAPLTVTVAPRINHPPTLTLPDDFTVNVFEVVDLFASLSDDAVLNGGELTVSWSITAGVAARVSINPVTTTVTVVEGEVFSHPTELTFEQPGSFSLQLAVSDGQYTVFDSVSATVFSGPVTTWFDPLEGDGVLADTPLTLMAESFDHFEPMSDHAVGFFEVIDEGLETEALVSLGSGTNQPGTIGWTLDHPGFPAGVHVLQVTGTDAEGLTASARITIRALSHTGVLPTAEITSPLAHDRITAPTDIHGSATSPLLRGWMLEYRPNGTDAWVELHRSADAIENAPLAQFDPTLLRNGVYEIRLTVEDLLGRISSDTVSFAVDGGMKIGHFALAFEDLSIPVSGIPVQLIRSYDSRGAYEGDFGPGWDLGMRSVQVFASGVIGAGWEDYIDRYLPVVGTPIYKVRPINRHVVSVVVDDEVQQFEAYSETEQGFFPLAAAAISFRAINGSQGTLELVQGGNFAIDREGGEVALTDFFDAVDPEDYRYTTTDGTALEIRQVLGLRKISDLRGHSLTITENGIANSDGVGITLTRDAQGRITTITDPAGAQLAYTYDDAGRLETFTNRVGDTTRFKYENAAFPHYLTSIIDPRGIEAIACDFDVEGRLIGQRDATGANIAMEHNLVARTQTVTDRLGHATTYHYDLRGNVTRQVDAEGSVTTFDYWPGTDDVRFETDHYGNVTSMVYDADGNLLLETIGADVGEDPTAPTTGYTTAYTYNALGAPTSITDPGGRVTTFAYDPATNDLLFQVEYDEDEAGNPVERRTGFTYDARGDLASMTDALGNVTTYTYDHAFSDPAYPGAVRSQIVTVTDAEGTVLRSTQSLFDRQENQLVELVTRTVYGLGSAPVSELAVTAFHYDAENRLVASIAPDPDGDGPLDRLVTETRYNAIGQEAATLVWPSLDAYQSNDPALARITTMEYDLRGNLVATVHPDGTFEDSGYDLENRRVWSRDRNGHVTYYVYDKVGRLTHTIFPDATTPDPESLTPAELQPASLLLHPSLADNPRTETVYDAIGRVLFSIDERGGITESVYEDNCGCAQRRARTIQQVTDPATGSLVNLVTHYAYDPSGNLRFVTDPRGNTTETRYDERNRPTTTVLPATDEHAASTVQTVYDALGRRVATIDQAGLRTDFVYDGLGRLIEVLQPSPRLGAPRPVTSYLYDETGSRLAEIDALGHVTTFAYDALGRRTERTVGLTLDDPSGTLDRTEAAAVFAALASSPESATETYTYNAWGQLAARTDFAGFTTTYAYYPQTDYLHREIADPAHPSLLLAHAPAQMVYTYDAAGNRTGASVVSGPLHGAQILYNETWTFDERGRPTYRQTAFGDVDYAHDAAGNLTDIVTSTAGGARLAYTHDELNRLRTVDDHRGTHLTEYTYNANGSLETATLGNSARHTYVYDALNRLRFLEVDVGGSTLHGYEYGLKVTGHRERIIESTGRQSVYRYDGLHRMVSETITGDPDGQNGVAGYTLDAVGNRLNRLSTVGLLGDQSFSFDTRNLLQGDTYDANGNTLVGRDVPGAPPSDEYDAWNRLIQRTEDSGRVLTFLYDADGTRIGKRVDPRDGGATEVKTTFFLNDTLNPTGYSQVLEEFDGAGADLSDLGATLTLNRVHAIGLDLLGYDARDDLGQWHLRHFSYDGHGSVRELLDESGAVLETYTYDAFGILLSPGPNWSLPTANAYLYTGERYDPDLGLYYLRARYMNPGTGRFHTMDTYEGSASDPLTLHKYLYANASPVNFIDPSGERSFSLVIIGFQNFVLNVYLRTLYLSPTVYAGIRAFGRINLARVQVFYQRVQQSAISASNQYAQLVQAAQRLYPKLAGYQNHHLIPVQLADKLRAAGVTIPPNIANIAVRIPAAYHQQITNAIAKVFPRGPNTFSNVPANLNRVLRELELIYERYPLPL
jgi:RHS repeat-associated protein